MPISSIAGYAAAFRERPVFYKADARSAIPTRWYTLWDQAGTPAAGALVAGNTANGIVPTDGTVGALGGGSGLTFRTGVGCITDVYATSNSGGRALIYDRLFHAGQYPFNALTTLAAQPSFANRIPNGDFSGTQLWFEACTSFTGSPLVTVTYTNHAGVPACTTGPVDIGGFNIGMIQQVALAPGDSGLQKIESVTCATATVGSFNLVIARPLVMLNFPFDADPVCKKSLDRTGMPIVYPDSCIAAMHASTVTAALAFDFGVEISSEVNPTPDCVWSPLFRSVAACVFSPSDGHLSLAGSSGNLGAAKGTNPRNSGKRYFEVLATVVEGGSNDPMVGIGTGDASLVSGKLNVAGYWSIQSSPQFYYFNGGNAASGVTYVNGDTYQVAVDLDAGKIWFGRNNAWILSGNPAAGTNPAATTVPLGTYLYPAISMSDLCRCTAHFTTASFTYTPPTGFVPW